MIKLGQATVSLELREVFKDGRPIRLGSRAFDILELLIAAQGRMVSKDELLKRVWPDTVVEENNLQVHISALRKALGSERDIIKTIAGRGYRLLMQVESVTPVPTSSLCPMTVKPVAKEDPALIGREQLLAQALTELNASRLLTLIGPGGVGKTSLARALGTRMQAQPDLNVRFVSLEKLHCADLLVEAVACALGVDCLAQATAEDSLFAQFKQQRWLIILDNCEHLIESVARLCERILLSCPSVTVLATSRESLRIGGEHTLCVPGLDVPYKCFSPEQVAHSSAVALFLERTGALGTAYRQDLLSLSQIASICRHLDGLPLAIEMAASRTSFLGLAETLILVQARPHGLTGTTRTAGPRHQALVTSLDISYELLNADERRVLGQLARLKSGFTFADACRVSATSGFRVERVITCIGGLISKSWLSLCQTQNGGYWLLGIARTYLLEKREEKLADKHQDQPSDAQVCSALNPAMLWHPDGLLDSLCVAPQSLPINDHNRPLSLSGAVMEQPSGAEQGVVYIVDDEQSVRIALDRLLRSAGFTSKGFPSAYTFLDEPLGDQPACLLLDVNLANVSGFDVQAELTRRGSQMPIIFMTGFGTIPLSVKAMKAGAHEFLTKPFNDEQLLDSIRLALHQDRQALEGRVITSQIRARYETLTPREREVLPMLVEGKRNRDIALELGTREITSKVHKKHIMTKMGAGSLLELVKMCGLLGIGSSVEKHNYP
ncbi:MAG: hypothetical protein JWP80_4044 [Pseudomonas sp.]|nr:hypothetical protein [Pseudomonas sp.]